MISGLDLNATIDFIVEKDKENPTIFKLGVLSSYLFARISAEANKNEIQTVFKILQLTIKGWENGPIQFETVKEKVYDRDIEVVPISILEQFPIKVITELSVKSMEINQITDIERKN